MNSLNVSYSEGHEKEWVNFIYIIPNSIYVILVVLGCLSCRGIPKFSAIILIESSNYIWSSVLSMQGKKQVTYEAINSLIISIRCCNMDEIKKYLDEYDPIIVNRLETQTRQPSLYFSAILPDHKQSYEIMKLLIEHGATPHFKDNFQQTILFYVCREGKQKCLDLLLENGLDLNDPDLYGQTPIYYAAKQNRLNIIHRLIEKKADLNIKDLIAGQTPLFYAAKQGHLEMCKVLVQNGCDLSILDSNGKMAAHIAKKNNHLETFQYLNTEYQNLKDQKKISIEMAPQSAQNQQKQNKTKRKKQTYAVSSLSLPKSATSTYRLYRADNLGNLNEVTYEQFEELMSQNPELNNMMRKPDDIDTTQVEQVKIKDTWIRNAQKVLTICWKAKGGYYFHEPVDPAKYGVDDYFDVITQPMDFGTIRKKLTNNVYNNIEQFMRDMNLVFDNCVKYNGVQNMIAKHSIEIKNIFDENMKQMGYTK